MFGPENKKLVEKIMAVLDKLSDEYCIPQTPERLPEQQVLANRESGCDVVPRTPSRLPTSNVPAQQIG